MAKREREKEEGCWLNLHDGPGGHVEFDRSPGFVFVMMARYFGGADHDLGNMGSTHCDHGALRHAIQYGMRFDIGDVAALANIGQPSYYARGIKASEGDYAVACGSERGLSNRSFALVYEEDRNRKPFLLRDPDVKTPTRMYVGRKFMWHGEQLTCTSFQDPDDIDGTGSFIGTKTSGGHHDGGGRTKVEKRIRITHADIKAYHAALDGKTEAPAKGRGKVA